MAWYKARINGFDGISVRKRGEKFEFNGPYKLKWADLLDEPAIVSPEPKPTKRTRKQK